MHKGKLFILMAVVALVAAGCGSSSKGGSSTATTQATIGKGEGAVSIVAWAGYIEDGSDDKAYDWVTPFEKDTGCKVSVKTAGTSDEMVSLMTGSKSFDLVTASGDASLRLIQGGTVQPVNLDLIPGYKKVDDYAFDPAKAKQLMADAGYPNGQGLSLTYTYRQREVEQRVAEQIQAQLKENLGLDIKVEGIDWKIMLGDRQDHKYTMFYGSWGHDFPDPQNWFYPLFHSSQIKGVGPGTGNDPGWSNKQYDTLVEQANKLADPSKREDRFKLYQQAEEILLKDAPLVPLYQPLRYWEIDTSKWTGYGTGGQGIYPFYMVKPAQ